MVRACGALSALHGRSEALMGRPIWPDRTNIPDSSLEPEEEAMSVRLSFLVGAFVVLGSVSAGPHDPAPAGHDPHAAAHAPAAPAPAADAPAHDAAPAPAPAPSAANDKAPIVTSPDEAMKLLVAGNARFVANGAEHPHTDQNRRCDTFNNGQNPFAVLLSCADSRAPVELLFDQGIGDLFVIRVAGNVADTDEIGTIEYGVGHLHSPLVVVMGHTACGAVKAVVGNAKVGPNIAKLVDNIVPAAQQVKTSLPGLSGDALVQAVVDANVMRSIRDLFTNSEEVRHLAGAGKIKVVGAVYDLHNGTVRWLGEHPQQSQLLGTPPMADGHAAAGQLMHDTPAAKHDAPAHGAPAHGAAHSTDHSSPAAAGSHADGHGPTSSSETKPTLPHQSGTMRGMLIPAAFIGGAGAVGTAIIYMLKSRAPKAQEPAAAA